MKILLLTKRFPQGRDLLTRPYGRFYHLPRLLAAHGHAIRIATLGYRGLPTVEAEFDGLQWSADDVLGKGPYAYWARVMRLCREWQPDWIIGGSDTYFGILAAKLGARFDIPSAIDAYDDFESYLPWARPLHAWWRKALAHAELVTAAGPSLAERLKTHGARRVEVLPMAADPAFRPMNRDSCRSLLGLPEGQILVGHLGAFNASRGHQTVLEAVARWRSMEPGVTLVLTGKDSMRLHRTPGIVALGYLPDRDMPALVNSLDVACVSLANNAFGRASHPAKLCEAMACGTPVVASDSAPTRWMLGGDERFLVPLGEVSALAERLASNALLGQVSYPALPTWPAVASRYEELLALD